MAQLPEGFIGRNQHINLFMGTPIFFLDPKDKCLTNWKEGREPLEAVVNIIEDATLSLQQQLQIRKDHPLYQSTGTHCVGISIISRTFGYYVTPRHAIAFIVEVESDLTRVTLYKSGQSKALAGSMKRVSVRPPNRCDMLIIQLFTSIFTQAFTTRGVQVECLHMVSLYTTQCSAVWTSTANRQVTDGLIRADSEDAQAQNVARGVHHILSSEFQHLVRVIAGLAEVKRVSQAYTLARISCSPTRWTVEGQTHHRNRPPFSRRKRGVIFTSELNPAPLLLSSIDR